MHIYSVMNTQLNDMQVAELIKGLINKGKTARGKTTVYLNMTKAPIELINGLIKLGYWVKLKGLDRCVS